MNARRVGRELAILTLTQFADGDKAQQADIEQLMEQGLRLLFSETESELQLAAASLQQAENSWEDAVGLLAINRGHLPPDKQEPLKEHMDRAFAAAQYAINMTGQAFQLPLMRTLADSREVRDFAIEHVRLFIDHRDEIDGMIDEATKNWTVERLATVDRNILRAALTELLYRASVPVEVAINEAVELAKKYGADESPRFVNGVLGGLMPQVEQRRK